MNEEYRLKSMTNITRYLHNCYIKNEKPNKEFMDTVDFLEKSKKSFHIKPEEKYQLSTVTIDDFLYENVIYYLPFEAYKDYISISWLENSRRHDKNLIHSLKHSKNLNLLNVFHDLILEDFIKNGYSNIFHDFSKDLFKINNLFDDNYGKRYTEEECIKYLELIKKTHNEKIYVNNCFFSKNKKKPVLNYNDKYWYKSIESNPFNDEKNPIIDFVYELSYNKNSLPILKNLLEQLFESDEKLNIQKLFKDDLLNEHNTIHLAISKNNIKTLDFLKHAFNLSDNDILNAYDSFFKNQLSIVDNYDSGLTSFFKSINQVNYVKIKETFFPNLNSSFEPIIFFPDQSLFKNQIKSCNKNIINNKSVEVDFKSIHYYICVYKAINLIKDQVFPDKKLDTPIQKYDKHDLSYYFFEYFSKNTKQIIKYSDSIVFNTTLSDKEWLSLTKDVLNIFMHSKLDNKPFNTKLISTIEKTLDIIFITQNMPKNDKNSLPKIKI